MNNTYIEHQQMDLDMTLQALTTEVGRLENLSQLLGTSDRAVLQLCSSRINRLVLDKLENHSSTSYQNHYNRH